MELLMPVRLATKNRAAKRRSVEDTAVPGRITVSTFNSKLGWIAVASSDRIIMQLTFGHATAAAAIRGLNLEAAVFSTEKAWPELARRLTAYAAGKDVDLGNLTIDVGHLSTFERRVIEHCRRIPYGQTLSYGGLAALAGSPRAARAVGNIMAGNRCPLVVPCHRVVHASGEIGNYSASAGRRMKLRLLESEGAWQDGKLRLPASRQPR
jgi:methylated-DNA-[protein]-cysteine S-methyltransferase